MVSVYMPDERISMFPYALSTELLSLGAGVDSFALSCGVTLNEQGRVIIHLDIGHNLYDSRVRVEVEVEVHGAYTLYSCFLLRQLTNTSIEFSTIFQYCALHCTALYF